jgi:hypothetical protein
MPKLIPDTNAAYDGSATAVTVALLAAAECPHGHNIAYNVPDIEDLDHYQQKATQWAIDHANTCTGAQRAHLKAA